MHIKPYLGGELAAVNRGFTVLYFKFIIVMKLDFFSVKRIKNTPTYFAEELYKSMKVNYKQFLIDRYCRMQRLDYYNLITMG